MALVTAADFRDYFPDLPSGAGYDTLLTGKILPRAEAICLRQLRPLTFAGETTATDQIVFSNGGPFLLLPPHTLGSVTAVIPGDSADGTPLDATAYSEQPDGSLYRIGYSQWTSGRYRITANWGTPTTAPADLIQVILEIAVNIWRSKDKGLWAEMIGVQGGGELRYIGGMTTEQRKTLREIKLAYLPGVIA